MNNFCPNVGEGPFEAVMCFLSVVVGADNLAIVFQTCRDLCGHFVGCFVEKGFETWCCHCISLLSPTRILVMEQGFKRNHKEGGSPSIGSVAVTELWFFDIYFLFLFFERKTAFYFFYFSLLKFYFFNFYLLCEEKFCLNPCLFCYLS